MSESGAEGLEVETSRRTRTITLAASNRNAMSSGLVAGLREQVCSASAAGDTKFIVRSGNAVFSSGFDLRDLELQDDASLRRRFIDIQSLLDDLRSAPFVSIAIVDGAAVGAGADLAIACDFRIGTVRSRFRFPGSRFGVALGTSRLFHVVGPERGLELMLGDWVSADRASRTGLLTHRVGSNDESGRCLARLCDGIDRVPTATLRAGLHQARAPESPGAKHLEESLTPGLRQRLLQFVAQNGAASQTSDGRIA